MQQINSENKALGDGCSDASRVIDANCAAAVQAQLG